MSWTVPGELLQEASEFKKDTICCVNEFSQGGYGAEDQKMGIVCPVVVANFAVEAAVKVMVAIDVGKFPTFALKWTVLYRQAEFTAQCDSEEFGQ